MWWIVLMALTAYAQDDIDISPIQTFEQKFQTDSPVVEDERKADPATLPPKRIVPFEKIQASGIEKGAIEDGHVLIRISDGKKFQVNQLIYARFYRREDEEGFKYIVNKDNSCTYKIDADNIASIEKELELYEPPLRYTPAPPISRTEYDADLKLLPSASVYAGIVQGDYMKDLFNDNNASHGYSTQLGLHLFTKWKIPLKVGGVFHYENARYDLKGSGKINYSSYSFGPLFKSKDFDVLGGIRFAVQFRVGPFAKASAQTQNGHVDFKFNSADLLIALEHPIKNEWGEFVLGFFTQSQWLNIKDQSEIVSVNSSNETNKSFGLSFAQVFD